MPFAAKNAAPAALTHPDIFTSRHIGPNAAQISAMLKTVGAPTLDALIDETVPKGIRRQEAMHLPLASGEAEALAELQGLADRNKVYRSYLGMGYANCILPAVIRRNVLENPGWYTQYTPYQAEISQGRLEGLLSFQTLITDLTGLPVANASLLDEATAAAEAMTLIHRVVKDDNKNTFFVARDCHPQVIEVVRTRAEPLGITILVGDHRELTFPVTLFGALLQYPATDGAVRDYSEFVSKAHAVGAKVAVATDLLALCLLIPPGEWDADIAVGNSQRFGVPLGYGGPHAAFMACKEEFRRQLPGRIVGVSKDTHGRPALRLALQTREQHIRREKATSNICTAQALLANMAAFYAIYHGPAGLRAIAERLRRLTAALANGLGTLGFTYGPTVFVDTLRVDVPDQMPTLRLAAEARCINLRAIDAHTIGIALDETTTLNDVSDLLDIFNGGEAHGLDIEALAVSVPALPENLVRKTSYLQHAVFNRYHSETEMMRYLKRLEGRDLSLTNSMIPLGSCTMKLNAASEMLPVTWNGFANIHPFAPVDQTEGYQVMFRQLEDWLSEITGFAGCSLQPNAGSQGEYAGLLVIRAWHHSRGQGHRDICLIPTSAHGTNPATASMAGLSVIAVACDAQGNIDLKDLAAKAVQYKDCLACLMVTYPSTHGVFEEGIVDICRIVHEYGGQVYMDGANMNAQVGLTAPGVVGADVCHLNLHKTFCIPHGGGGPGMGPICVARHLVPFLPKHSVVDLRGDRILGAVSAAPWGSSLILTISWMYIRMMGAKGLTDATKIAILNANYIAKRLEGRYPVLYTGRNGRVAHECIIDVRQLKAGSGVDVEDIAKRLMDYGFHAPTVSFPVPGTLMIEPTESESQSELDRFCDAMISIHAEIQAIIDGKADKDNNLLHHAPHTLADICSDTWDRPYGREQAAFPLPYVREQKFWPSVNRIDGAYGDRNPVCTCVGMDAYTP